MASTTRSLRDQVRILEQRVFMLEQAIRDIPRNRNAIPWESLFSSGEVKELKTGTPKIFCQEDGPA